MEGTSGILKYTMATGENVNAGTSTHAKESRGTAEENQAHGRRKALGLGDDMAGSQQLAAVNKVVYTRNTEKADLADAASNAQTRSHEIQSSTAPRVSARWGGK